MRSNAMVPPHFPSEKPEANAMDLRRALHSCRCVGLTALLALAAAGSVHADLIALPERGSSTLTGEEIAATGEHIRIEIAGRELGDVLQFVQNVSGIQFTLSSALLASPLSSSVAADDWTSAVRELLRPFNTAEVWLDDRRLHRVIVIAPGEDVAPPDGLVPQAVDADRGRTHATREPLAVTLPEIHYDTGSGNTDSSGPLGSYQGAVAPPDEPQGGAEPSPGPAARAAVPPGSVSPPGSGPRRLGPPGWTVSNAGPPGTLPPAYGDGPPAQTGGPPGAFAASRAPSATAK